MRILADPRARLTLADERRRWLGRVGHCLRVVILGHEVEISLARLIQLLCLVRAVSVDADINIAHKPRLFDPTLHGQCGVDFATVAGGNDSHYSTPKKFYTGSGNHFSFSWCFLLVDSLSDVLWRVIDQPSAGNK